MDTDKIILQDHTKNARLARWDAVNTSIFVYSLMFRISLLPPSSGQPKKIVLKKESVSSSNSLLLIYQHGSPPLRCQKNFQ